MADLTARSLKRRRTEHSPVSISPEQIVQSNATVEHFMGQRHNRWIQGHVSAAAEGVGGHTGAARSRTALRQTGRATSGETRPQREENENHGRWTGNMPSSAAQAYATWQLPVDAAGANEASPPQPAAGANIVNYESPYSSFSTSAHANARSLMDPNINRSNIHPGMGLPSPAPSDENTNSPIIASMPSTVNVVGFPLQPPKRGHPRKHPPLMLPTDTASRSPATQQQDAPPTPSGSAMGPSGVYFPAARADQRSPPSRGQSMSIQPSAPPAVPQRSPSNSSPYASSALKARIDLFEQSQQSRSRASGIDEGRLVLLRDAVWPQLDWFYLALSQVHALAELQNDLPEVIRSLPPNCWKALENLLCSNKRVSPTLLNWLAHFPAPIRTIYSDSSISSAYNTYINAVANFLRELPTKWDVLVSHCGQVQAPPLAQDLALGLGLGSTVLQTVAFRAITRMIFDGPSEAQMLDHLELLHRCDQQAYNRRRVRQQPEKTVAYRAFQALRGAWAQYVQMQSNHDARQKHFPPMSRTVFPPFNLGYWVPGALATFQGRQALASPAPTQGSSSQQQLRTPLQQQQAMIAHEQRLFQAQIPNQPGSSPSTPTQPNMAPRQPQLNGGFPVVPMPPQRLPPGSRLVFPHESDGPRSQPTEPNPTRSALHEAHLRSPVPVPLRISDEKPQLYRFVGRYALSPQRLDKDMPINTLVFDLPQDEFAKIPKTIPSHSPGELPNRILSETSQTYRLRCCAISPKGFPTESDWVVADTHWPDSLYMELNGRMLETRRPLHHKKHLPIDLTTFLKPGLNEIRAAINRMNTDKRPFDFAIAVEMVSVVSHSTLITTLNGEQTISAATTKASIQNALSGVGRADDDDDLAITSTSMTIKLFDPFSGSKIFTTPVRGAQCPHKDCFDLQTFLSQCKRDRPGHPTIVDCWRCPLCRGDVRPSVMVRDEWLVDVRKTLKQQGKLDTRAIVVEADGSWRPKPEKRSGVRSASMEREERGVSAKKVGSKEGTPAPKKVVEVIELD